MGIFLGTAPDDSCLVSPHSTAIKRRRRLNNLVRYSGFTTLVSECEVLELPRDSTPQLFTWRFCSQSPTQMGFSGRHLAGTGRISSCGLFPAINNLQMINLFSGQVGLQRLPFPASPLSLSSCFSALLNFLFSTSTPNPHPRHLCAPLQRPLPSCPLFSLPCAPGTPTSCSPQARPAQRWNEVGTRVGPRGARPNPPPETGCTESSTCLSRSELQGAYGSTRNFTFLYLR